MDKHMAGKVSTRPSRMRNRCHTGSLEFDLLNPDHDGGTDG
jgi:hypothetical protein